MSTTIVLFCFILTALTAAIIRLIHILPSTKFHQFPKDALLNDNILKNKKLMIFLGSGGHTGEMLRILSQFDIEFLSNLQRRYLLSTGDSNSILKLKDFEMDLLSNEIVNYIMLPRARHVHEPILLSIKNSCISLITTLKILLILRLKNDLPDVLLINGPGTAATLSYLIIMLKFFNLAHTKIIYIESLARVKKLSISGRLVRPISDRFIVQWEGLNHGRAEYYGILV